MSSTAPHQALYRRWRAQTFGQIVGQDAVVETLRNAVRSNQVAHALLFVGPRGTGKTSMARIVAKALNCTNLRDGEPCDRCEACVAIRDGRALDVIEMDAASNNKVDDMRDLVDRTMTTPSDLRRKVYIVDEVQRITQGWDVLLRTLEEPPDHVAFIFCTTDASQIRPAVLSRVQRYDFRRLTVPQIEGKLRLILDADGRDAEPEAISLVAHLAAGGMRDAESMLDQLLSAGAERLTAGQVRELLGLAEAETIEQFIGALVAGDALAGLEILDDLEERGRDLRSFLDQVVDAIRVDVVDALARTPRPGGSDAGRLVAAGRLLGAIDPSRGGPGGLRFQLELALLSATGGAAETSGSPTPSAGVSPSPPSGAAIEPPEPPRAPDRETPRRSAKREEQRLATAATEIAGSDVTAPSAPRRRSTFPAAAGLLAADPAVEPVAGLPVAEAPGDIGTEEPVVEPAVEPVVEPVAGLPAAEAPGDTGTEEPDRAEVEASGDTGTAGPAVEPAAEPDPLAELRARWPEIVAHISQHPPTKPLIVACRPISVDGDVVTLGFPEGQAFLRDVAERRRTILEEGVGRYLGRTVTVRCVATNLDLVEPIPEDADRSLLMAEARRIFADDLVDVGEIG